MSLFRIQEDIEVYEAHILNLKLRIDTTIAAIEKQGRNPTASEAEKLATLQYAIDEYQDDVEHLKHKLNPDSIILPYSKVCQSLKD